MARRILSVVLLWGAFVGFCSGFVSVAHHAAGHAMHHHGSGPHCAP